MKIGGTTLGFGSILKHTINGRVELCVVFGDNLGFEDGSIVAGDRFLDCACENISTYIINSRKDLRDYSENNNLQKLTSVIERDDLRFGDVVRIRRKDNEFGVVFGDSIGFEDGSMVYVDDIDELIEECRVEYISIDRYAEFKGKTIQPNDKPVDELKSKSKDLICLSRRLEVVDTITISSTESYEKHEELVKLALSKIKNEFYMLEEEILPGGIETKILLIDLY